MVTDLHFRWGLRVSLASWLPIFVLFCNSPVTAQIVHWGNDCCGLTAFPPEASDVVALAGGDNFGLGLRVGGRVLAWGPGSMGETNVPPGLWNAVAIAAGWVHGLALRANGTVAAWGDNSWGQTEVPAGLSDVVAIAAGGTASLALRADGSLVGWGAMGSGSFKVPPNLPPAVAIAVGGGHALALRADGRVMAWGDNSVGQLDVPSNLTNAVAIAATSGHTLALTAAGSVVAWGDNLYGQTEVPVDLGEVRAIAAGYDFSLALKADGTVVAWGADYVGQTNVPPDLASVAAIAAGGTFGLALLGHGAPVITSPLVDRVAVLGLPAYFHVSAFGLPPMSHQWQFNGVALSGETNSTLELPEVRPDQTGSYSVEVRNSLGVTQSTAAFLETVPLLITAHPRSQTAFWGNAMTLSVEAASALPLNFQWHFNGADLPGETHSTLTLDEVRFPQTGRYAVTVANELGSMRSAEATLGVTQLLAWGDGIWGQTNVPPVSTNLVDVSAYREHSLALRADGKVLAWGYTDDRPEPVPGDLDRVVSVSAGVTHDLALRDDGTVVAWGADTAGQTNVPAGLNDVVAVAAGWNHSLALKSDGTVARWGGTGAVTQSPPDLQNVVDIAAADTAALALRADGTVVVWGGNSYQRAVPSDLTNAVAIAAGGFVCTALTADGRVVAWGNWPSMTNVPAGFLPVLRLDTGASHQLVLQTDGTLAAWGDNAYGELVIPAGLTNVADVAAGYGFSVVLAGAGPSFVGPPLPQRATPHGLTAWLRCTAVGEPPLSYQWRFEGQDLPGAHEPLLTLPEVTFEDAGRYSMVVSNALGRATNTVDLAVPPLMIVEQPRGQTLLPGITATLRVTASSSLPLSYQWHLDGQPLAGATNNSLVLTGLEASAAGSYDVEVSNDFGSVRSAAAAVSLTMVMVWGTNTLGQLDVPTGLNDVVGIGSGDAHCLVVNADGTVAAWGDNRSGQTDVPPDLTDVVAVAGGGRHSLALHADGRVTAWGDNSLGQSEVPSFLNDVVSVAAGGSHSLALRADGTVLGWGVNTRGQANPPPFLSGVVAIAAGESSSLALRSDGAIVTWTTNGIVIPAPGAFGSRWSNSPPAQAVAISSRGSQHVALLPDGTATVWGTYIRSAAIPPPEELSSVVAVAAGYFHFMALKDDGVPATWGARTEGGSWLSPPSALHLPGGIANVAAVAAGTDHSLALAGVGPPSMTRRLTSVAMVAGRNGYLHASATGAQPLSYHWRFNGTDIPGATGATLTLTNVQPAHAGDYSVVVSNSLGAVTNAAGRVEVVPVFFTSAPRDEATFPGGSARFEVAATGVGPLQYQWQFEGTDLPGATGTVLQLTNVQSAKAGWYSVRVDNAYGTIHTPAARLMLNQVVAWGDNTFGNTNVPAGLTGIARISQGELETLALKTDGTVVSWGSSRPLPPGLDRVVDVTAGLAHGLALRDDGTVIAWGDNYVGETNVPPGLTDVQAIAARGSVNFAITRTGGVLAWGDLDHELAAVPSGLENVVTLSIGRRHALALLVDGSVAAWGNNESGQIEVPFGLNRVVKVLAVHDLSLALRDDGIVMAWGDNSAGQATVPANLREVVSLASSGQHVLALTRSARVVAWGDNFWGQTEVPPELGRVRAVVAGDLYTSLALKEDGTVIGWGLGLFGQSQVLPLLENVSAVQAFGGCAVALLGDAPPSTHLPLNNPDWDDGEFRFEFFAPRDSVYALEFTDSLAPLHWTAPSLVRGEGTIRTWTEPIGTNQRFYRVRYW